jgi:hypothetical protein
VTWRDEACASGQITFDSYCGMGRRHPLHKQPPEPDCPSPHDHHKYVPNPRRTEDEPRRTIVQTLYRVWHLRRASHWLYQRTKLDSDAAWESAYAQELIDLRRIWRTVRST